MGKERSVPSVSTIDWRKKPAVIPIPGREPYDCALCRDRVKSGQAIRWGPRRSYAVHDECARKLPDPERKVNLPGPPLGPLTLDRWENESPKHHRGFLLWLMQHPTRRNRSAVARALAGSNSTIRDWEKRFDWERRGDSAGVRADEQAVKLYRELYGKDFGPVELPEVAAFVGVPLGVRPASPLTDRQRVAERIPLSPVEEQLREADKLVREEILRKRKADDETRSKHVQLVDGALGYVVKEMKEGKIRASLRDIPTLLQARAILSGEVPESGGAGVVPLESMRVRLARERGTDFLDAVAEDVEELSVVVKALRERRASGAAEEPEQRAVGAPDLRVVGSGDASDAE